MRPTPDPSIGRTSTGMASDYAIRDAGRADIDTIVAFTLQEVREAEDKEPDLEAVSRGVRGGFEDAPHAAYWVAEAAGGRVVASTSVVREWSDFHGAYYWWVQSLFIIPEHRGKGLVELLLRHLAREAGAAGALDLRLLRPHHQRTRSPGLPPLRFCDGAIRHHDEASITVRGRDERGGWRPDARIDLIQRNARVSPAAPSVEFALLRRFERSVGGTKDTRAPATGGVRMPGRDRQAGEHHGEQVDGHFHRRVHRGVPARDPDGARGAARARQGICARRDRDDQLRDAHVRPERASSGAFRRVREAHGVLSGAERDRGVQGGAQALQDREGLGAVPPRPDRCPRI